MFKERQSTTPVTSPQMWLEYAKVLYDILGKPPLPQPHDPRPHESTFFTLQNVKNAINQLPKNMMDWQVSALSMPITHCSHCTDTSSIEVWVTVPYRTYNCANLQERKPHDAKQFKDNHDRPLVGKTTSQSWLVITWLNCISQSILESELGVKAEREVAAVQLERQAFDHLVTIHCLIEEDRAQKKRFNCCFVDSLKAFNIVLQRLEDNGVPQDIQ